MYYASAIDCSVDQGKHLLGIFKELFKKYPQIEVYGAGIGESPIINLDNTKIFKKTIVAYDLRKIRECDIFLMVTDLKTYCAGTHEELMYARQLGLCIIVCILGTEKVKSIFIESHADRIVYGIEKLENVLGELCEK